MPFISGDNCCEQVSFDKVPVPESKHVFVVHTFVEPCATSVCIDCIHLCGERLVEPVRDLIRPLRAETYIRVGLHSRHDNPLPVRLIEGQVPDKE